MKTWSFIGSDKNAGKTTVLNYVHRRLREAFGCGSICLTSIGINGEEVDNYEQLPKPRIPVYRGNYFVTSASQLSAFSYYCEPVQEFSLPNFRKRYLLGRCLHDFLPVLEGPNTGGELLMLKEVLQPLFAEGHLLIDGSIDRQFLGHPGISDAILFSLLVSSRPEQQRKAAGLLFAFSIPECSAMDRSLISGLLNQETRSLLLDDRGGILYRGGKPPFLDDELKAECLGHRNSGCLLYLNGALTRSFHALLAPLHTFRLVLDNFTLYQNISVSEVGGKPFRPGLSLRHPAPVRDIFLNREVDIDLSLPAGIQIHDLFRDHGRKFNL